jgi:hypothetical protein
MAGRKQSKGHCTYCKKELSKGGISKHIAACPSLKAAIAKVEQGNGTAETLFHLRVQDTYASDFWLDLEMRGSKSLNDLDSYLRGIWLECCGHMSQFMIGNGWLGNQIGKQRKIEDVFQRSNVLTHIYDMGTSSETLVKAVSTRVGKPLTNKPIVLLARNQMPEAQCQQCDQPATHFCEECVIEDETSGMLCQTHVKTHAHHNYGEPKLLVNSPRLGMCGYCGPAEAPY